jgi:hypothetical protein
MPTSRINGADLYYQESGSGFPALFIQHVWKRKRLGRWGAFPLN